MEAIQKTFNRIINPNETTTLSKTCSICGHDVPSIEIEVLGRMRRVQPKCKCEKETFLKEQREMENYQREREVRELFSISDVGNRYLQATFDNFQMRAGAENVFKLAKYYVERFQTFGRESLLFWGDPGNGKTHLAVAIHNALRAQGYIVVFVSMPDLLAKIRNKFNKDVKGSGEDIMKALMICDLLIIDDVGAEKTTEWTEEVIFRILDGRYRREKPVISTSNIEPSMLEDKLSKRIYDRLKEMQQPVHNTASSWREERAKERFGNFKTFLERNGG